MGYLKGKSIVTGVSGKVGVVIVRQVRGKTVLQNRPTKRAKVSENQKPAIERFKDAQLYAKRNLKDPAIKALYKKGITVKKNSAHAVATSDFLHPPIIHYIKAPRYSGAAGSVITIKATDDFRVASVEVSIIDGNGTLLETSPATVYRLKPFIWKYKTTVVNTAVNQTVIRVTAKDYAANEVSAQWTADRSGIEL